MALGGTELLIILALGLFALIGPVLAICCVVSASKYPDAAFEAAGTTKMLWIVLPLVGIVVCGIVSLVAAAMWFGGYKERVAAAAARLPAMPVGASQSAPTGTPPPPPPVTPANWYPDPRGRHELRYFDGHAWTDHVSDTGRQTHDPI